MFLKQQRNPGGYSDFPAKIQIQAVKMKAVSRKGAFAIQITNEIESTIYVRFGTVRDPPRENWITVESEKKKKKKKKVEDKPIEFEQSIEQSTREVAGQSTVQSQLKCRGETVLIMLQYGNVHTNCTSTTDG